jgi:hypothetical protein
MLQIVYMLLKKDGSVPKVDYQYVYTWILECLLFEKSPNISFAYFSLQSRLMRNREKCEKMLMELLHMFNDSTQVPSSPVSTTKSFIREIRGSPESCFLHSVNCPVILEGFPADMRMMVLEHLQERSIPITVRYQELIPRVAIIQYYFSYILLYFN